MSWSYDLHESFGCLIILSHSGITTISTGIHTPDLFPKILKRFYIAGLFCQSSSSFQSRSYLNLALAGSFLSPQKSSCLTFPAWTRGIVGLLLCSFQTGLLLNVLNVFTFRNRFTWQIVHSIVRDISICISSQGCI